METGQGSVEDGVEIVTLTPGNLPPVAGRFVPGESGNPDGKKKGTKNFSTILKALAEMPTQKVGKQFQDESGAPLPRVVVVADQMLRKAEGGDIAAATFVADRMDGKPVQAHEVTDMSARAQFEEKMREDIAREKERRAAIDAAKESQPVLENKGDVHEAAIESPPA